MFNLIVYNTGDIVSVKTPDFIIKNHFGVIISSVELGQICFIKLLINEPNKEKFLNQTYRALLKEVNHFNINTLDKNSNLYKILKVESTKYKLIGS